MNLSLSSAPSVGALIVLGFCVALALTLYLTRYPMLPPRRRGVLVAVRAATLVALVLASLAPVFRYSSASRERNRVLILVDRSGSMEVPDGDAAGRSRREVADSAAVAIAENLKGRYDVRIASFDATLGPVGKPESWSGATRPRGAGETALGDALREALVRMDPDSVAAFLVLSDGAVNRGEDPERALEGSVPVFALVVGAAENPPTTGIGGVDAPGEVVVDRPAVVTVTIRHGARSTARGVARIREGSRELGRAPFALEGSGAVGRVALPFTLREPGKHFLAVTLDSLPGDPLPQNKRRFIVVNARPPKRLAPLLASAWDWDLRSFARGVEEDTAWAVVRYVPSGPDRVAPPGGTAQSLTQALRDAEVAAARYDARTITPERAADWLRFLERGGGLLLWVDPRHRPPTTTPFTRALGIEWRDWSRAAGLSTGLELTASGRGHEISLLGGDAATAAAAWRSLPPVQSPLVLSVRGSPLVPLLEARFGPEAVPILFAGRVGAGRVAVLNASGVYRWGLTASGLGGSAGVEASFFGGLCRWLARSADDRPVTLSAPAITAEGRPIPLRISLASPADGPGARAIVSARRIDGSGRGAPPGAAGQVSPALTASGEGGFSGSIALPEGIHSMVGRVDRGGRLLGIDSVRIAVGEEGVEFESLRADPAVLERLASSAGGAATPIGKPEPVLARLRSPDLARARLAELDLFHNVPLFVVLVLGASVEWILRKRYHLL
ncbi:MAG: VWA domain-containing protein [Candidatus Latescibacteria bacterium]|nr:VWA domain-containing protein [Candidatus Latescibacterota bacterium]